MKTTSDLNVNHHFCAIISPYPIMQFWKYLHVCDHQQQEVHSSDFESCKPFGKKLIYFGPMGFVIQKNYDSETPEFKLHSFRAFQ